MRKSSNEEAIMEHLIELLDAQQTGRCEREEHRLFSELLRLIKAFPDKRQLLQSIGDEVEDAMLAVLRHEIIAERLVRIAEALDIEKHKKKNRSLFDCYDALGQFQSSSVRANGGAHKNGQELQKRIMRFFTGEGFMAEDEFAMLLNEIACHADKKALRKKLASHLDKRVWEILIATDEPQLIDRYFRLEHAFGKSESRIVKKKQRLEQARAEHVLVNAIREGAEAVFMNGRQGEMALIELLKCVNDCPNKKEIRLMLEGAIDEIRERAYHVPLAYDKYRRLEQAFGTYKYMLEEWDKEQEKVCLDDVRALNRSLKKANGKARSPKKGKAAAMRRLQERGANQYARR